MVVWVFMNKLLEQATKDFTVMMHSGKLDAVIIYDLIQQYKFECASDNDWAIKDALRKVIKLYTSDSQYEEFKKEVGLNE